MLYYPPSPSLSINRASLKQCPLPQSSVPCIIEAAQPEWYRIRSKALVLYPKTTRTRLRALPTPSHRTGAQEGSRPNWRLSYSNVGTLMRPPPSIPTNDMVHFVYIRWPPAAPSLTSMLQAPRSSHPERCSSRPLPLPIPLPLPLPSSHPERCSRRCEGEGT